MTVYKVTYNYVERSGEENGKPIFYKISNIQDAGLYKTKERALASFISPDTVITFNAPTLAGEFYHVQTDKSKIEKSYFVSEEWVIE